MVLHASNVTLSYNQPIQTHEQAPKELTWSPAYFYLVPPILISFQIFISTRINDIQTSCIILFKSLISYIITNSSKHTSKHAPTEYYKVIISFIRVFQHVIQCFKSIGIYKSIYAL